MPPFDMTLTLPLLVSVATLVFAWFRTRRQDVDERFAAGSKKLADLEKRLSTTEMSVRQMPGKDDIHQLQLMMAEMGGDMKAMRVNMKAVADSLVRQEAISARHEEYLRENK
jgi:Protein of unknown function (DUF2730)